MDIFDNIDVKKEMAVLEAKLAKLAEREHKQGLCDIFIKRLAAKNIPVSYARGRGAIDTPEQIDIVFAEVEAAFLKDTKKIVS